VVRFGELTPTEAQRALALSQRLGLHLVPPDGAQVRPAFEWTVRPNRAAAYDSSYLALAEILRCQLWTADRHLHDAVNLPWECCAGDG